MGFWASLASLASGALSFLKNVVTPALIYFKGVKDGEAKANQQRAEKTNDAAIERTQRDASIDGLTPDGLRKLVDRYNPSRKK